MNKQREALEAAYKAHKALREWIAAIPQETVLPGMPGMNGEWLDEVELKLKAALAEPDYEALYEQVCEQYNTLAKFVENKPAEPEQEPIFVAKTWFEDGKMVTQFLKSDDVYKNPKQEPILYCVRAWGRIDHSVYRTKNGAAIVKDGYPKSACAEIVELYTSPQPREWQELSEDGMTPIQHPQNLNQPVYKETADAIKEIEKLEGLCSPDSMASLRQCVFAMNAKMHSLEYKLQTRVWHELEKDDLAVIADALDVWTEDCVEMYKLISADLRAKNGL